MAPLIKGQWPSPDCPPSTESNGIFIHVQTNRATVGYGIDAFVERNPLAWPSFATAADVEGFPPVVISVNECDPLQGQSHHGQVEPAAEFMADLPGGADHLEALARVQRDRRRVGRLDGGHHHVRA
jgi:hypothetical protein